MTELYHQIRRDGAAAIDALVEQKVSESVTLEFKRKARADRPEFERPDKQNLGQVLSGFANSAGGLCIWGIEGAKGEDGIDCAQSTQPIIDIARFATEAKTLAAQYLMPRFEGIAIEPVLANADSTSGYLLVCVDRSNRRPHRSEAPDDKRYYKRAVDSFFAMEHYDIEDAFRRRSAPELSLLINPTRSPPRLIRQATQITVDIEIAIRNEGSEMCRYPYVAILLSEGPRFTARYESVFARTFTVEGWRFREGGADTVLHPGRQLPVASVGADFTDDPFAQNRNMIGDRAVQSFSIELRAGGEGVREIAAKYRLGFTDLAAVERGWKRLPPVIEIQF
jgi:hypothetical protein